MPNVPQPEIVKDALHLVKYDSSAFQVGTVESPPGSDFPRISWALHLLDDTTLIRYGNFWSGHGFEDILEKMDSKNKMALIFSDTEITTLEASKWASVAVLVGLFDDIMPFQKIVIAHYDDYEHARLEDAVNLLERGGVAVLYAPPSDQDGKTPLRDASDGTLRIVKEPAPWVTSPFGRRLKREKPPLIRYTGDLSDALKEYFAGSAGKTVHEEILKGTRNVIGGHGKDVVSPEEFVSAISLGHYALPKQPNPWSPPKDAWHVEETLKDTDIIANETLRTQKEIDAVLDKVEDYLRIWNTCADPYGMCVKTSDFFAYKEERVNEMAQFIGADSAIAAYSAGVGIDDVLA